MIGIFVISHGKLAEGIVHSGAMVGGAQDNVSFLSLDEDILQFAKALKEELTSFMKKYREIIILCDLKGGTPFNESMRYIIEHQLEANIKLITGVNLPMYIEVAFASKHASLTELAALALESGKLSIELLEL